MDTSTRPIADAPGSAFAYVQEVSDELDHEAGEVSEAKQWLAYGGIPAGMGTAIAAAAKAAEGITIGFGSATGLLTGLNTAGGIDARSTTMGRDRVPRASREAADQARHCAGRRTHSDDARRNRTRRDGKDLGSAVCPVPRVGQKHR
jgi:hypothetical protein